MLYHFAKLLMTAALRLFYRRVHVSGFNNIPEQGPVIIIANHQSSLMDAALMGILLKRKAWFFARGDVFVNRPIRLLLWWLHMVPVHGYKRGKNNTDVNDRSFEAGKKILRKGGIIVFFPESTSHVERELYAFRKGVFRLGFDAAMNGATTIDIPIVPIGITYDHPYHAHTSVQVHAGEAFALSAYQNDYASNPAQALLRISRDAWFRVEALMLHIGKADRQETAEQLLALERNNQQVNDGPWKIRNSDKLRREQSICRTICHQSDEQFMDNKEKAGGYFRQLKENGISDQMVNSLPVTAGKKIGLWMVAPLALAGIVLNAVPLLLGRYIADKKVFRLDFYSWIYVVSCALLYCTWILLLGMLASLLSGWLSLAVMLITLLTGLIAYHWLQTLRRVREHAHWVAVPARTRELILAGRPVVKCDRL